MDTTPQLGLSLIAASQAQKHVPANESFKLLDAIVMLAVIDSTHTAPPGAPAEGDRYRVAAGATGTWAGWDLNVAVYNDGQWTKLVPKKGWSCYDENTDILTVWNGATWTSFDYLTVTGAGDGTLTKLGINTAADATNRFAVKSDAILLSHDDVTPGTGDMRAALNKSASGKDAGFVFQDAYSARALFGLLGDDDFTIKVSPDGSTFKTGLVVDRSTGKVNLVAHSKFSAYLNFGQNYAAGAWQDLLFNNFRHNDQGDAAVAANVLTFTAPHDGYYLFGIGATYETTGGAAPDKMQVGISVNGAAPNGDNVGTAGDAAITDGETQALATVLLKLSANDTVSPQIFFTTNDGRVKADENYLWACQIA
jgi:hypothetical protein